MSAAMTMAGSPSVSLLISEAYTVVAFWDAVASTYSKGESDLGKLSGTVEGIISRFVRPILRAVASSQYFST